MKRTAMPGRRVRLRYRSRATAAVYRRVRGPLVAEILAETVRCEYPQCWQRPVDCHERLRRSQGGSPTDRANILALCRKHHDEVTFHPRPWMYEHGLLQKAFGGGVPTVKIPFTTLCEFCRLTNKHHCDPCRIHEGSRVVTVNAGELP